MTNWGDKSMNFGFTDEQTLLRTEARKFLSRSSPLPRIRELVEAPSSVGSDRNLWNEMSTLGWIGLCLPEKHGGAGLDLETLIVILEETGRALLPSPLISTVLVAQAIGRFGSDAQQSHWLPSLANGSRIGTFAFLERDDSLVSDGITASARREGDALILSGEKLFVPDAAIADLFVVPVRFVGGQGDSTTLIVLDRETPGLSISSFVGMDLTKPMGTLTLSSVRVSLDHVLGALGQAWAATEWLLDLGAALVTAEAVGSLEAALEMTTKFAKERIQFGEPIGHFQGVKHPLAEIYVDLESFRSLAYYAIWALDHDAPDAQLAVSRAKAYASDAFAQAGIMGVQLHGGVGYTWEYDIQLYLKRSKWFRPVFGDADYHYERAARLGGL